MAATCGFGALAVLFAAAIHSGMPTGTSIDVQAKGNPTGLATASVAPTMEIGQTMGHSVPTTTTVPGN